MHDRRKFISRILATGTALGIVSVTETAHARSVDPGHGVASRGYAWQRTIFSQHGDTGLLASIGTTARHLGCDIWHGKPDSLDIIAIPCFAIILDRTTFTQKGWAEYLAFRREVQRITPCIVVDCLGDGHDWPIDAHMDIRSPGDPAHVRAILKRIREAHKDAQAWKPEKIR